jgi:hypothetical protein
MWCDLNGLSHGRYVPRASGTWDVETITAWELEQYLPFF